MKRAKYFMKKKFNVVLAVMIAVIFVLSGCGNNSGNNAIDKDSQGNTNGTTNITATVTEGAQIEATTTPDDQDTGDVQKVTKATDSTYTVMVYICAADLEADYGCATADILEMSNATYGDNVNVIIETGGTSNWQNEVVSNTTNQIYQIKNGELFIVGDNLGLNDMTNPQTLTDFITFCSTNYPADVYQLILWDHGGGAVSGYGYDENYSGGSMEIDEIDSALTNAGVYFDFVGFDACLMSTVETAYMLSQHADYMIASEELEPGLGWYYTNWLTSLSTNPEQDTVSLAKLLIDDFVAQNTGEDTTLAITNLSEIGAVYTALCDFMNAAKIDLDNQNYATISQARSSTKDFGGSEVDHIDIVNLAQNYELPESDALVAAVDECVEYHSNSSNIENANGLSMYFPYTQLDYFNNMLSIYENIGMDSNYTDFLISFVTIMLGGQACQTGSDSPVAAMDEEAVYDDWSMEEADFSEWEDYDWFDSEEIEDYAEYYEDNTYSDELIVEWKNDEYYALALTQEDWDIISAIECQVLIDDGEGYIDLGSDNLYEFDDDGDLKIDFDNTWVSINGQNVCFYAEEEVTYDDGTWYSTGIVPAYVNDELVDIVLVWDDEYPDGYVAGIRYSYGEGTIQQKGLGDFYVGDVIDFICDYYTYDGEYDDIYLFGEQMIVTEDGFIVSYEDVGSSDCLVCYMLTDVYQNQYWTESVLFYEE